MLFRLARGPKGSRHGFAPAACADPKGPKPSPRPTSGKTINGTRYRYSYYNCRSATRRRVSVCPGRRMATAALDRAVIELVRESACRDSRFTALGTALGRLTANPRDTLAQLLTSSEAVARVYLLHLVELIEVFEDVIIVTPRTERRFHGKIHWIRPDCA